MPDALPALRYEQPLVQYATVRYELCGRRLSAIVTEDNDAKVGYFKAQGDQVVATVPLNIADGVSPSLRIEALRSATDWELRSNDSHAARLVPASESMQLCLLIRFEKLFGQNFLPTESGPWTSPHDKVPAVVKLQLPADRDAPSVATPPSKRVRKGPQTPPTQRPAQQGEALASS